MNSSNTIAIERFKELQKKFQTKEDEGEEGLLVDEMTEYFELVEKLPTLLDKLAQTVKVAEWFLDEKELRLDMYYSLKADKESKEWQEFEKMDNEWIKLTEY